MKRLSDRSSRLVATLMFAILASTPAFPQSGPPPPGSAPPPYSAPIPQEQLDALLAPIALYPDELLTQVLMAATYPLEVVEAARFSQQNPGLRGPALDDALQDKTWDPSVQSLAAFPQVLAMMNDKLDWTQQLGDAFLSDQGRVMDTVQMLRARAQAAGNLQSTAQQRVYVQQQSILIEPAQPDYVYVPVYNPVVVYGPWWSRAYRPWYWYPPPAYGYPVAGAIIAGGIIWGSAWAVTSNHWGWARPVWGSRNISINVNNNRFFDRPQYRDRYHNGNWEHMPEHRRGVAYRDPGARDRYQHYDSRAVDARRDFRGNDFARPDGSGRPGGVNNTQRPGNNGFPRPEGNNREDANSRVRDQPASAGAGGQRGPGGNNVQRGSPESFQPRPGTDATQARPGGGNGFNQSPPAGPSPTRAVPSAQPMIRPSPNVQPMVRPSPNAQPMVRPSPNAQPAPSPSPVINTREGRPQVQQQSDRGQMSRESANSPGGGEGGGRPSRGGGGERGRDH